MPAELGNPLTILIESVKRVRVNIFAFGVVGIVAAAVTCIRLAAGNWVLALAGGAAVLVGMVVLRVFANLAQPARRQSRKPMASLVLTWFCLLVFVVVVSLFVGRLAVVLYPDFHRPQVTLSNSDAGPAQVWHNFSFSRQQTGQFTAEVDATPLNSHINA